MNPFETKSFGGSGGHRGTRSESVTVRLEPRIRYFAELAGRIQRRNLSSVIEEAIAAWLRQILLKSPDGKVHALMDDTQLWDVFEPDRFVRLALHHPELLNHHEQIVWKLIQENELLWKGQWNGEGELTWDIDESTFRFKVLRGYWDTFNKVARGEQPMSALPSSEPMRDDEIPF